MKNSVLTLAPRQRQALPMLEGSGTRKLGGRDPMRALQRTFSLVIVALFVALFPSRAHAFSWMIKHGYSGCPVCHADPSGGELLTAYGRAQSELLLRMPYGKADSDAAASSSSSVSTQTEAEAPAPKKSSGGAKATKKGDADDDDDDKTDANSGADDADDDDDKPAGAKKSTAAPTTAATPAAASESTASEDDIGTKRPEFLWGLFDTPDWLLLGGSYRHLAVYKSAGTAGSGAVVRKGQFVTFPMMADVYGQVQIGNFRVEGSLGIIRVGVGSPYGRAAQITTGQGDQWNLLSRTHWLGYDFGDGRYTLRAGHLNLPFGIRIPEHTMFVRTATRTDRESAQQDGVALAFNGEDWRGELMGIAGNYQVNPDRYRERGYSGYLEYMLSPHAAIGVSSLVAHAKADRLTGDANSTRQAHGLMLRTAVSEKTVILGEADILVRTNHEVGYVGFLQGDLEATQGLHFMLTGEVQDQGYDSIIGGPRVEGAGKLQLGGWATIDWFCFSHVEVRADVYSRQGDSITALGQFHVFL